MASQPANSTISVFLRVRSQRDNRRSDDIKSLIGHLRPLKLVIPGREDLVVFGSRTAATRDFSPYVNGSATGFPVTVTLRAVKDFNTIQSLTHIATPIEIGPDKLIEKQEDYKTDDLFTQAQAL